MTQAAILLVAFLFLALICPRRRGRAKLPRAAAVLLWVLTLGYSFAFFKTDMLPDLGIYTQQWVTQRNGFALNFTVALRYSSVEKPDGYSHDAVLELKDQYPGPGRGRVQAAGEPHRHYERVLLRPDHLRRP